MSDCLRFILLTSHSLVLFFVLPPTLYHILYKRDPIYQGYRSLVILALLNIMPHPTTTPWTLFKSLDLSF
ncbi:uncharacterized protein PGTG_06757 [Puccinia graminis f. sp. tritici CRL 75-36-700-3]|uniref:Uncharacterized protein n=1 Tax=Puccinia graminis f. sp. tritici (strain CRL 75-36-700-3 / race SCCL) TaxID=418459 RepID=E3K8V5_PUCGT|nr:uncharacterized protein PGTG_06757 [Puccinia graminis f. sp. tritici CRL 75-36-700-3]EFP80801.1 hypothetical protein PGTG_06757 [Puccinia graminis f. sp. tritici CRL 75-36-700-3]